MAEGEKIWIKWAERQVTRLARERSFQLTASLGSPDPIVRRANLLLGGVDLIGSRQQILTFAALRVRALGDGAWEMRVDVRR